MRKTFPGYYRPTEDEFQRLWREGIFVLDANVMLNLYRYSEKTRTELLDILKQVSEQLWVPHQAALEYHNNRVKEILKQEESYQEIKDLLQESQNKLDSKLNAFKRHSDLAEKLRTYFADIEKELDKKQEAHPKLLENDFIRDALTELLDGKVGRAYPDDKLNEIYRKGKSRYENKVPPGYKDVKDKTGKAQFGDLVLWFQMIDFAKGKKQPVIFVTDDAKEDWWLILDGKTIGPRPELISEMLSEAGVQFYAYQVDRFMHFASIYLKRAINLDVIQEAEAIRRDEVEVKENGDSQSDFLEFLKQYYQITEALKNSVPWGEIERFSEQTRNFLNAITDEKEFLYNAWLLSKKYDWKKILGLSSDEIQVDDKEGNGLKHLKPQENTNNDQPTDKKE